MSELRNDQMPDPTPAPPPAETPRKTTQERLKEITANIERGIQELFSSDKYRQYLATMSRFHRYSVNNQMLIYMQRPDATLVAGYGKWQKQFERHVNRGEKGITTNGQRTNRLMPKIPLPEQIKACAGNFQAALRWEGKRNLILPAIQIVVFHRDLDTLCRKLMLP